MEPIDWSRFTEKQKNTIAGYIKHGKKHKAFVDAHDYKNPESKASKENSRKFFKSPKVVAVVEAIQREAFRRANLDLDDVIVDLTQKHLADLEMQEVMTIDAYWVLRRAALLADFNINSFVRNDEKGLYYDFSEATHDDWYCISELTTEVLVGSDRVPFNKVKIKTFNKLQALDLVGKHVHVGAFNNNITLSSGDGGFITKIERVIIDEQEATDKDS